MGNGEIAIPLATVTDIANYVLAYPQATIMEVMAQFDLNDEEAMYALATAKYVIRTLEDEAEAE